MMGAPSLILWLVMSSLVIGVSQLPTGASLDAIAIVRERAPGAVRRKGNFDLQIIITEISMHISAKVIVSYASM